ncbi:hypothetical protein IAU59_002667 [Kwoniella sp. CBS 9459]
MNPHQVNTAGPSTAIEYHPPLPPHIPLSSINSLIPRLTTTINDIDSLKALIAAGNTDGTLPSWDTLLQRYSLLLGRINALTNYLSPPPSTSSTSGPPATIPASVSSSSSAPPPLDGYLVHPLNPLPDPASATGTGETISPLAAETFFQVINTIPLPSLSNSQDDLLHRSPEDEEAPQRRAARGQGPTTTKSWHTADELRRMEERQLDLLRRSLKGRLDKEVLKAGAIKDAIQRSAEEVDWTMRIGEDEDEDEDEGQEGNEQEVQVAVGARAGPGDGGEAPKEDDDDDDDDDLFGDDDEDDEEDEKMIIDVDGDGTAKGDRTENPLTGVGAGQDQDTKKQKNPVEGWKVEDYIRFMDGGKVPPPS